MKQVSLSQGKFAVIDDEDYERVSKYKWCINSNGYAVTNYRELQSDGSYKQKAMKMHRFIMNLGKGESLLDHKDLDKLNNQKYNLRLASHSDNLKNKKIYKNNKSGYKGVNFHKSSKLYVAKIRLNNKQKSISYHKCPKEAARAYNVAAIKYFGEFASLNEIK